VAFCLASSIRYRLDLASLTRIVSPIFDQVGTMI
jgi:hypothetical protein